MALLTKLMKTRAIRPPLFYAFDDYLSKFEFPVQIALKKD